LAALIDGSKSMKCRLCEKDIENYSADFNHLFLDKAHSADICLDCARKFSNWQGEIIAKLFPTKAMKKRFGEK